MAPLPNLTPASPKVQPAWLDAFLAMCSHDVPYFLEDGALDFLNLPTTCRADLSRDITQFVPNGLALDELIAFSTSGSSGHPLTIPSHPLVAARYQAFHRRALALFDVFPDAASGQLGVALIGAQQRCFSYVSLNPLQNEAGLIKINLNPSEWRDPLDPARYLDDLAPELITGDPLSLMALAALPLRHCPRAILSTSMQMLAGVHQQLEARFHCPVLDIYSMNEAGPIAVYNAAHGGHVLLQPWLWLEILDATGQGVAQGERGEITLTGGFNPWLPLRRYRTGDYASLQIRDGLPVLIGLNGRPPVRFKSFDGRWVNNVDISQAMQPFALAQFTLHQAASGALEMRYTGVVAADAIRQILQQILGKWPIQICSNTAFNDKIIQYTSDILEPVSIK
jgi:phenylacetate-CoA ligase